MSTESHENLGLYLMRQSQVLLHAECPSHISLLQSSSSRSNLVSGSSHVHACDSLQHLNVELFGKALRPRLLPLE